MSVTPVLASRFEGCSSISAVALRDLGAEKTREGWTFPDGSKLVLVRDIWRALAPDGRSRRV
jgi:hypothetical protein